MYSYNEEIQYGTYLRLRNLSQGFSSAVPATEGYITAIQHIFAFIGTNLPTNDIIKLQCCVNLLFALGQRYFVDALGRG